MNLKSFHGEVVFIRFYFLRILFLGFIFGFVVTTLITTLFHIKSTSLALLIHVMCDALICSGLLIFNNNVFNRRKDQILAFATLRSLNGVEIISDFRKEIKSDPASASLLLGKIFGSHETPTKTTLYISTGNDILEFYNKLNKDEKDRLLEYYRQMYDSRNK